MRAVKGVVALACSVMLAAGAVIGIGGTASAAVANYNISLEMLEGAGPTTFTITGSFSFDPAACGSSPCPEAYSNISISVPARPSALLPAITYDDADICPTAGMSNCGGKLDSDASTLSLSNTDLDAQSLWIVFTPNLTQSNPGIDLANTEAYSETGGSTTLSATLANTSPTPTPVAQVPTSGSVTVPSKLRLRGTKKIASAQPVTNAGQRVRISVACRATRGDVRVCAKITNSKGTYVRTYGRHAKVTITWRAPEVAGFTAYRKSKSYRI